MEVNKFFCRDIIQDYFARKELEFINEKAISSGTKHLGKKVKKQPGQTMATAYHAYVRCGRNCEITMA